MKEYQNNWVDYIQKQPQSYLGKYIVHDSEVVYFAANSATEANVWMKKHAAQYPELTCILLPNDFFMRRFLSIKGSRVPYLEKAINIEIDRQVLEIPVCWCLDPNIDDLVLGRERIFEKYRVIFDEQMRKVIFEPFDKAVL